jgi:RimJ/RimL family protein N-acetyltransferase
LRTLDIDGHHVVIRTFERGDAIGIASFAAALPEHDLLFLSRDIKHAAVIEAWWQAVDNGEISSFVAVMGSTVIGSTAIVRDPLSWSPHVAEIRLLVAPEARGHGLGRMLLEESIKLALENGATKLTARMTPDQRSAIALFEELGFRGEAMLRDHVKGRDGNFHDLAVLSMHSGNAGRSQSAWGFDSQE